jgi:hypothetical protein
MNYLELPDLNTIVANLDEWLVESQKLYETAIKQYIKFKEQEIEKQISYNKKFAETIVSLKDSKHPITYTKEIAKAQCGEEYKDLMMAESQKKHYKSYIGAFESRINMIKILMRIKIGELGNV